MTKLLRYTNIASLVSTSFIDCTFIIPSAFGLSSVLSTSLFRSYVHAYLAIFLSLSLPFFLSFILPENVTHLVADVNTTIFRLRRSPDTRIILHPGSGKVTCLAMQVCKIMKRAWDLSGWRDPPIALWSKWDVFHVWNRLLCVACQAVSQYRLLHCIKSPRDQVRKTSCVALWRTVISKHGGTHWLRGASRSLDNWTG